MLGVLAAGLALVLGLAVDGKKAPEANLETGLVTATKEYKVSVEKMAVIVVLAIEDRPGRLI